MKPQTNLNEIRQDYEATPIPKEVKQRVIAGITQAKKEQKQFYQKPVFWARFGGCIAAAAMLFVLLANFNTPLAHAMSEIPILGSIVEIVSFDTFESKEKDMKATINIPEVNIKDATGKKNETASDQLNATIKDYTDQIIAQYQKDVDATKGEGQEEVTSDYKVICDTPRLFSLKINTTISLNTSDITIKIYHVDKATGKIITLADIFQKDTAYLSILTDEIKCQMRKQMAEDDTLAYFIDDEELPEFNWQGLTKDANFYINNSKLIVVFDKYEVAPGYMGVCEFVIPDNIIQDIANAEYFK